MGRMLLIIFFLAMVYLILKVAVRAWKKVSLKEKFQRAEEIEGEFKQVQTFEENYKDISEKNKKVSKFKKETL